MTISTPQKQACHDDGSRKSDPPKLVWRKVSPWVIETNNGRYRIERFAVGNVFRYRILKILSEWFFELAPSETTAEAARKICEADVA